MSKGILYVVSAPSGCGKGTILESVLNNNENLYYSVSATTRKPREGEIEGVNYYFYTKDMFKKMIQNGDMLEHAMFCENYYGTPKKKVEEKLDEGYDVILEIETNGAMQVKKNYPDAILIFILPPSVSELRNRLNKRKTESIDIIEKRLSEAIHEINCASEYDFIMVNGELMAAVDDFEGIIRSAKLLRKFNYKKIDEVLNNA